MGKNTHPQVPQDRKTRSLPAEDRGRLRRHLAAVGFTKGAASLGLTNEQAKELLEGGKRTPSAIVRLLGKLDVAIATRQIMIVPEARTKTLADAVAEQDTAPEGGATMRAIFVHAEGGPEVIGAVMGVLAGLR